ncbi:MAG: SPOR domain-containing protein, partial [Burkholderiales bacterium]
HLNTIAKYLEIEKVFVYRTFANQKPSMTVLYGSFATRAEADSKMESLAEELKANRPYYRTIRGIRAEIAQHNS